MGSERQRLMKKGWKLLCELINIAREREREIIK